MSGRIRIFLVLLAVSAVVLPITQIHGFDGAELPELLRIANQYENFDREYIIKPGDVFFISILGAEPQEIRMPVTVDGKVILHPVTTSISVTGKNLAEAREAIRSALLSFYHDVEIDVVLQEISPQKIHILGAVNHPGEYVVDSLSTLYRTLNRRAGGITPAGSRKINVMRSGELKNYDLNKYIREGDLSQNPLLYNNDIVYVGFAEKYAKIYVVTDSVNYVDYFELEEQTVLETVLLAIRRKHGHSDYKDVSLMRNGELSAIGKDFLIEQGDIVYVKPEGSFIYIRGNVTNPGQFTYIPGKTPNYYLSLAGGITRYGTERRIRIIRQDGDWIRYREQPLLEGDTIVVPASARTFIVDYLTPISTILSMITTIIVITR